MIPLRINGDTLLKIFDSSVVTTGWSEAKISAYSIEHKMYPTSVDISAETYSRDAERSANYELNDLTLVNAKAKHEMVWSMLRADWGKKLLQALGFKYNYKDPSGTITPIEAPEIEVEVIDLLGKRTISAYLGQNINTTLEYHNGVLYFVNFRIALIER